MVKYIVIQNNRVVGFYDSFNDAVEAVVEIGSGEIYRVELVAKIREEEAHSLRDILLPTSIEPVEAPVVSRKTTPLKNALVIDRFLSGEQVVKLTNRLKNVDVYLLTTSREIPEAVENVNYVNVESSLDVCSFVEDLVERGYRVVVFTNDKKLYTHLSKKKNIHVFYKIIGEYSSVDDLIESILRDYEKTTMS